MALDTIGTPVPLRIVVTLDPLIRPLFRLGGNACPSRNKSFSLEIVQTNTLDGR